MKTSRFNGFLRFRSAGVALAAVYCMQSGVTLAADLYWDNSGGTANDWGSIPNWSTVAGGGVNPAAIPTDADLAIFSASSVAGAQTINLGGARAALGLSLTSTQSHSLQGGGTNQILTLAGSGINKTGTGALVMGSATAGQQVALALSANQTFQNNENTGTIVIQNGVASSTAVARALTLAGSSTAANQINGVIANNGTAALNLIKAGAGTWILGNTTAAVANTFSGGTAINAGTLIVETPVGAATYANLGTGGVSVNGGSTLHFRTGGTANVRTFTNPTTINSSRVYYEDGNTTLSGAMLLIGTNTFTGRWNDKNLTISGVISGAGGIVKNNDTAEGAVELILSGNNTFTSAATGGILRVNRGAVRLTNPNALGLTSTVLVENTGTPGGTITAGLRLAGGITIGDGKLLVLRNGGNTNSRTSLINVSGNNTWAGDVLLENQALQAIDSAAGSLTVTGNIYNSSTSPSATMFLRGGSGGEIVGNLLLGGASIAKTDGGTWTISSSGNTLSSLQISVGGLVINNNGALPATAPLTLSQPSGGTGTLTVNAGFSQEFSAISTIAAGNGTNVIRGEGTLSTGSSQKTFTVNEGTPVDDLSILTNISGTGGFLKAGAGNLRLVGSTVAGPVTVTEGTLSGTAVFNGLTVTGATLAPGGLSAAGALTTSTLALNSANLVVDLGSAGSDVIAVTQPGGLTRSGVTQITVLQNGALTPTSTFYPILTYTGASPGLGAFSLGALPGRVTGTLVDNGSAIGLSATGDRVVWTGATGLSYQWDASGEPDWRLLSNSAPTGFQAFDDVLFNNVGIARNQIALSGTVNPNRVEFAHTSGEYTLVSGTLEGGPGMVLTHSGAGKTTLATANTYNGPTLITAGILELDADTGTLTNTPVVDIANAGTLRLTRNDGDITFNRPLSGTGTVRINPHSENVEPAAARNVTLSGSGALFSGNIILESPVSGSSRLAASPAALGNATITVQNENQLFLNSGQTYSNNVTITGDGYNDALGSIGAFRLDGGTFNGNIAITGVAGNSGGTAYDARLGGNGNTATINGTISGGDASFWTYNTSSTTFVLTSANSYGDTIIGGTDNAATGAGTISVVVGDTLATPLNTTATLGSGTIYMVGGSNATTPLQTMLRIRRANGYTLGQDIIGSASSSANLARNSIQADTGGTGLNLNGRTIDLSDGVNGGALRVGVTNSGASLGVTPGTTVKVGNYNLGDAGGFTGIVSQTGGAVSVAQVMRIGHWPNNTSVYNLTGGSIDLTGTPTQAASGTNETNGVLYIGIDGAGIMNLSGGSLSASGVVLDNRGNSGAGLNMPTGIDELNLSGSGVLGLRTANGLIGRNISTAFNWNGGIIRNLGTGVDVALNIPISLGAAGGVLDSVNAGNSFTLMNDVTGTGTIALTGGGLLTLNPDTNATRTGVSTGTGIQSVSAALSGASGVTKVGSGTTTLAGINTYTGATNVAAGRLNLTGSSAASAFSVADGAGLGGEGTVASLVLGSSAGASLLINGSTAGALTATGALTVNGIATVDFDGPPLSGPIVVLKHGSTTATPASFALTNSSTYRGGTFAVNPATVTVTLDLKDLAWNGSTANWETAGPDNDWNTTDKFYTGDRVTFGDAPAGDQTIAMVGQLRPGSVKVASNNVFYTFTGTAGNGITGATSLVKEGSSILTLGGDNTFTGGLIIRNGIVSVGSSTGLGADNGEITVQSGGQLNFNGTSITPSGRFYSLRIAGTGPDGTGAIYNSLAGINENSRVLHLTLDANASVGSFGGTLPNGNRIDFALNGTITGNGKTLTKVGNAMVAVRGPATNISYVVGEGTLRVENSDLALGSTGVVVASAATLDSWGDRLLSVPVTFDSGGALTSSNGTATWSGVITLGGDVAMGGAANAIITQPFVETGSGLFTKTGGGTLVLTVPNTFTRKFSVTGGILRIGSDDALGSVPGGPLVDAISLSNGGRIQGGTTTGNNLTLNPNRGIFLGGGDGGFHSWTGFTQNYAGAVTGPGNFAKTDGGTFNFSGTADHTGTTMANGGIFNLNGATIANTSSVRGLNGTLNINGGTINTTRIVTGDGDGARSVINQTSGVVNILGGDNTNTTAASFLLGHWGANGASSVYNLAGGLLNSLSANMNVGWDSTSVAFIQTGGIANLRGINFANGRNNIATVDLRAGRMNIGIGGIAGNAAKILSIGGASLGTSADWVTTQAISLTGIGGSAMVDTLDAIDGVTARSITLSGAISGQGGLTKTGLGTVRLTTANTYTGPTQIDGGTMIVDGSVAGTAAVADTGTLGGSGTIAGATTVAGTLAPGSASPGTLGFGGTLTLEAGSSYQVDITGAATHDKVVASGAFKADGTIAVVLTGYAPPSGASFDIADASGITGAPTFDFSQAVLGAGLSWDTSNFATTGVVKVVEGALSAYDTWALANNVTGGPLGDADGDGVANLLEFATNSDAKSASSRPRVYPLMHSLGGDRVLTLTVAVRAGASFAPGNPIVANQQATLDQIIYTIEASNDLGIWNTVQVTKLGTADATAVRAAITPALPALQSGWEWHSFRTDGGVNVDPSDYIRLKVAPTP